MGRCGTGTDWLVSLDDVTMGPQPSLAIASGVAGADATRTQRSWATDTETRIVARLHAQTGHVVFRQGKVTRAAQLCRAGYLDGAVASRCAGGVRAATTSVAVSPSGELACHTTSGCHPSGGRSALTYSIGAVADVCLANQSD